jgi:hypothetical protein
MRFETAPGKQLWRERAAAGSARRRQDAPADRARARGHNRRPFGSVRDRYCARRQLGEGARTGTSRGATNHLHQTQALIIDELGYLPLEPDAAHLFFQLVSRRCERGAILITSNRSVGEWGTVFRDAVVATAILDRLLTTATSSPSAVTAIV